MRKIIFIFIGLLSLSISSQNINGIATYQTKTDVDFNMKSRQVSPEMQAQIKAMMKKQFEKTYTLKFNQEESIYQEEQSLDAIGAGGLGMMMGSFQPGRRYKNITNNTFKEETEFFGKLFLIEDNLEDYEWEMTNESKKIGQYVVFKAVATQKIDSLDFTEYRQKPKNTKEKNDAETDTIYSPLDDIELPKEKKIIAWYTPQIPIQTGPDEYWGLPGLILELKSGKTTMLCSKIVLNPKDDIEINIPSKGKSVGRDEYKKIVMDKVNEMKDMYGGGRRGGSGIEFKID